MTRRPYLWLVIILLLVAVAIWVDVSKQITITNPFNSKTLVSRSVDTRLGLDLRGGLQVVLEADLPADTQLEPNQMEVARSIIESRTNAFGVAENSIQLAGERRIVGEFPGLEDSSIVLATIQQQGLLEFVDFGDTPQTEGTVVQTDYGTGGSATTSTATPAPTQAASDNGATDTTQTPVIYHTVMTGADLNTVNVTTESQVSTTPVVAFELSSQGSQIFSDFTTKNTKKYLGIVLDKKVISSPQVDEPITSGQGIIRGGFTYDTANALAIQLRYGSLPVPLKVVDTLYIGPTLGEDSLQRSLIAGVIGMIIVILFMTLYYRLPGMVAAVSILIYAVITFAIFKFFHFTLTLPGIAGFLLSTGSALDANILFFERIKEELRGGLTLGNSVDKGWSRAWSSIRDSNVATIITSLILLWFGSSFGATIVKGFSLTLLLGVGISLFTAVVVSRTLLHLVLQWTKPTDLKRWFGI